jgi:hypothetical protein
MVLGTRRTLLGLAAAGILAACGRDRPTTPTLTVYKDPSCGCCGEWVEHLKAAGFTTAVFETTDRSALQSRLALSPAMASCHTAQVEQYLIEGHVPAADIRRLLGERPDARGLVVPGMPVGSPGMEAPDGSREAYDVLLVKIDGTTAVFAHHP